MIISRISVGRLAVIVTALFVPAITCAQQSVTELKFVEVGDSIPAAQRTLRSLVKVQGSGGLQQDGLYLLTHYGDREDLFLRENQSAVDHPWREDTWRYCSVFSTAVGDTVMVGRNWDNQNVGSIIINYYQKPHGYRSVSFCRAMDLGFPLNLVLTDIASTDLGTTLLLAPFFATDGINEHGLVVAVAGVPEIKHDSEPVGTRVFVTYLLRKILDSARTVDEAVAMAEPYVPFDLDRNSLNTHYLIADATGRSAVLEYSDGQWRPTLSDTSWQIMTNATIQGVPDSSLRVRCWRHASLASHLENAHRAIDWSEALTMLRAVKQGGTAWSVAYSPTVQDVHVTVYQQWDTVYHLAPF